MGICKRVNCEANNNGECISDVMDVDKRYISVELEQPTGYDLDGTIHYVKLANGDEARANWNGYEWELLSPYEPEFEEDYEFSDEEINEMWKGYDVISWLPHNCNGYFEEDE